MLGLGWNKFEGELGKLDAWSKAAPYQNLDPEEWRMDDYGKLIRYREYGKYSDYGWQIDHITPTALGGTDLASNKRALHHTVNQRLGGLLGAGLGSR